MDTITHVVLGACIGEAIAGKQLGKKALLIGAIAQSIPDIDFVASFWLPTATDLLAHRGFTHSFLFMILFTPLIAFLSGRIFKQANLSFRRWMFFWGFQIFIHLFIDAFNAYGTGWFEPFSHYRVSFNSLYVADPVFTIGPAIAAFALLILKLTSNKRKFWMRLGIWIPSVYLLLGVLFKSYIDNSVKDNFQKEHVAYKRIFTTPTPLNNLLWLIIAENDSGYYAGYMSVFDNKDKLELHYDYRNDALLAPFKNRDDVTHLLRFSDGYYVVQQWHDTLVFSIPRFGEISGWAEPHPKCAFYYFLQYPENNKLIVQRGRFAGWNIETFQSFIKRIGGN